MAGQDLRTLAQRLARRYRALLGWRNGVAWSALAVGLALILAAARAAWWEQQDWTPGYWALAGAWIAGLAGLAWRARLQAARQTRRLLGAADRQVAAEEQITTAYELELDEPAHPFLPLLRRRCEALVRRVDARALLPMQLHRPGLGALAFALAAFALYLAPSDWLRVTRAALTPAQALVAEEGARIRRFAERVEELAKREELPLAQALAKEAQVVGKAMEEKELSALDASQQLEGLIRLAEELANQAAGKGKDGFTGEQYVNFESESQKKQGSSEAGSPAGYTGGGSNQISQDTSGNMTGDQNSENAPEMSSIDDPFKDEPPQADVKQNKDRTLEMQVLERAQMQFQQAQRNVAEGGATAKDQEGVASASSKDAMEDMGNAAPEEMGAMGQEKSTAANSLNQNSGQDAMPSDAFGQGPTSLENDRNGRDDKPKETGFQDSQVFGQSSGEQAEEKWVRQLPTLNAREIRPDGSLQDFQQAAMQAQGGSAVPRAYRAVVRSYFMHLERLHVDQESGDTVEPVMPAPVVAPPDPGDTTGPEYQGAGEPQPIIDGARGPQR